MMRLETFDFVVAMLARNGQRHVFLLDSDPASVVALESEVLAIVDDGDLGLATALESLEQLELAMEDVR